MMNTIAPPPPEIRQWFMQRRIKLQHLRLLAALAVHATLHRAAEEIGISQPAASNLIADLESAIRHPLFERKGRNLVANTLGTVLIHRAQTMLRELEQASEELSALIDGRRGRITVGAIDGPTVNYLADALAIMQAEFPFVDVQVESGSSIELSHRLTHGEVDVMIGRVTPALNPRDYTYREIGPERFSIAGRIDHPLAGGKALSIVDLHQQNWIVQSRGSTLRTWFDALFSTEGLDLPTHIVNTNSLLMTLAYINRTDALTLLSSPVAEQQATCHQLAILPTDIDLSGPPYGLILPANRPASPALTSFLAIFQRGTNCDPHCLPRKIPQE